MGYKEQAAEWESIRVEMIDTGKAPTAYQVTLEQKKRCLARGEKFMEYEDIIRELTETPLDGHDVCNYK